MAIMQSTAQGGATRQVATGMATGWWVGHELGISVGLWQTSLASQHFLGTAYDKDSHNSRLIYVGVRASFPEQAKVISEVSEAADIAKHGRGGERNKVRQNASAQAEAEAQLELGQAFLTDVLEAAPADGQDWLKGHEVVFQVEGYSERALSHRRRSRRPSSPC